MRSVLLALATLFMNITLAVAGPGDAVSINRAVYFNATKPSANLTMSQWTQLGRMVWDVQPLKSDLDKVAVTLSPKSEGNEYPPRIIVQKDFIYDYADESSDGRFQTIARAKGSSCEDMRQEFFADQGTVQAIFKTPYGDVLLISDGIWTYAGAKLFHTSELNLKTEWQCK